MSALKKEVYNLGEVDDLLDWLLDNKQEVINRRQKLPELKRLTRPKENGPRRGSYRNLINGEYLSISILYSISITSIFYNHVLDSCRKIIELLVRYELDFKFEDDLRCISKKIDSLPWSAHEKIIAKEVYAATSLSVHSQITKLWEKTRPHAKADYKNIREELLKTWPEKDADVLIEQWKGIDGMEGFVLDVINKTVNLSNAIIR